MVSQLRQFHSPASPEDARQVRVSRAGLSPSTADHPRPLPLTTTLSSCLSQPGSAETYPPQPRTQPLPGYPCVRFSLCSAFARHYLRNHNCFLLYGCTEMFHFPAFPPHPICSNAGSRHHSCWVSPIRKSSDPRSVIVPKPPRSSSALDTRHPPCALRHLQTTKTKEYCTKNTPPLAGSVSIDAFAALSGCCFTPPPEGGGQRCSVECCLRTQQCVGGQLCCLRSSRPLQTRTPRPAPASWGVSCAP